MIVSGIPLQVFCDIVRDVSAQSYGGNIIVKDSASLSGTRFRVSLRTVASDTIGARRSQAGRKIPAVCWHGFRDVTRAALTAYPTATVRTMLATYRGLGGFESTYPATGHKNVGSLFQPVTMPNLCSCRDGDNGGSYADSGQADSGQAAWRPADSGQADIIARIDATLDWVDSGQATYRDSSGEVFYAMPSR